MKIDNVKFNNNRPYIEYVRNIGRQRGYRIRCYGQIIVCATCGNKSFVQDVSIKRGQGKYCSNKCQPSTSYKDGKSHSRGYIYIKIPLHPQANPKGRYAEHRFIIEKQIGRYLHRCEITHHINGIKDDNRLENLMLFKGNSVHRNFEIGKEVDSKDIIFDGRIFAQSN